MIKNSSFISFREFSNNKLSKYGILLLLAVFLLHFVTYANSCRIFHGFIGLKHFGKPDILCVQCLTNKLLLIDLTYLQCLSFCLRRFAHKVGVSAASPALFKTHTWRIEEDVRLVIRYLNNLIIWVTVCMWKHLW